MRVGQLNHRRPSWHDAFLHPREECILDVTLQWEQLEQRHIKPARTMDAAAQSSRGAWHMSQTGD